MFKCKFCGKEYNNYQSLNSHVRQCKLNPNRHIKKSNKKEYNLICQKCGKEYKLELTETNYNKGEYTKYCCRSCANSRKQTEETKQKISNSINIYNKLNKKKKYCKICGKEIINKKSLFCSDECKNINKKKLVLLKYFGLTLNNIGTPKFIEDFNNCRNTLHNLYWKEKKCFDEISKIYNYPYIGNLTKVFRSLNINRRNLSESINLSFSNGRHKLSDILDYNYKSGYHTTWNNKEIFYRSSYELEYAKILDKQNIDYEVESKKIQYYDSKENRLRIAIPDFYLPNENKIVEIKSYWTLDIQNMKDKIKSYLDNNYNVSLILEGEEVNINNINESFYNIEQYILEEKNKYHISNTGWSWINKDGKYRKVMKEDIDTFIKDGWILGRKGYTK